MGGPEPGEYDYDQGYARAVEDPCEEAVAQSISCRRWNTRGQQDPREPLASVKCHHVKPWLQILLQRTPHIRNKGQQRARLYQVVVLNDFHPPESYFIRIPCSLTFLQLRHPPLQDNLYALSMTSITKNGEQFPRGMFPHPEKELCPFGAVFEMLAVRLAAFPDNTNPHHISTFYEKLGAWRYSPVNVNHRANCGTSALTQEDVDQNKHGHPKSLNGVMQVLVGRSCSLPAEYYLRPAKDEQCRELGVNVISE